MSYVSTITVEQEAAIRDFVEAHEIPKGLGTEDAACTVAAINLALTGELTDDVPECMSGVIGWWVIVVQDAMPAETRNSREWKALIPLAAGTGRVLETERAAIVSTWLWETVLPTLLPVADAGGFGDEWRAMLVARNAEAAYSAADSAYSAADSAYLAAYSAADSAAYSAYSAADSAARSAYSARSAAYSAADSAYLAAYSADSAAYSADSAAYSASWSTFDPCGLLAKLISC